VIVFHQINGNIPTPKSIKSILSDFVNSIQAKSLTPKEIIESVAKFYDISQKDLMGNSRKKELVWPRQIAIYMMREDLNVSYPTIGQEMGGRDHTTAMHSYNKIHQEVKENDNQKLVQDINSIRQIIKNSTNV
jgi:chromosomal replication initiator protein